MAKDMASYLESMGKGLGHDDAAASADSVPGMNSADDSVIDAHDFVHMCEHGSTPDGKHKLHPDDHAMMKPHFEGMYSSMHDALDENGSEVESSEDGGEDDESYNHHEDNEE